MSDKITELENLIGDVRFDMATGNKFFSKRAVDRAEQELAALRAASATAGEYDGIVWHGVQNWHKNQEHAGDFPDCDHPVCAIVVAHGWTLAAALEQLDGDK